MSTSEAVAVGRVDRFVVDAADARVVALRLKKTPHDGDVLAWEDMQAFGRDAVTVESAAKLTVPTADLQRLADKHHNVLGKRVLATDGVELGSVVDVEFDLTDGSITSVLTESDEIAGSRLLGLGSYALVVRSA